MYLDFEVVKRSVDELSSFHPFFGITFLVCKKAELPVGHAVPFEINWEEKRFLDEFYRPDPQSEHFFQPFRTSSREQRWLSPKYPYSGSQSTRTRGDFAAAFYHDKNTKLWGWQENYVRVLRKKLATDKSGRIPAFWLAAWLYRNTEFPSDADADTLVNRFLTDFKITPEERDELFRLSVPEMVDQIWSDLPYRDAFLLRVMEPPPDADADRGASLRSLSIQGTGPVDLIFEPGERLSVITGDNGLGKSFLLECCWWALTGTWADAPAAPRTTLARGRQPEMRIAMSGSGQSARPQTIKYDVDQGGWSHKRLHKTIPGLIIYARVDGSFAVYDPLKQTPKSSGQDSPTARVFTREDILNGDPESRYIEGLLRDWVSWQRDSSSEAFLLFTRVLRKLSPPDMAPLEPGLPLRMEAYTRLIPTLKHDYGTIPVVLESAGVKRIVTLAYLLVWAWNEHKVAAGFAGKDPERKLVVMIDEMESHLHPKWQRIVLPALIDVITYLSTDLEAQLLVATHSPLILASCEGTFSEEVDKLFHLSLTDGKIDFKSLPFVRYGTVDAWLTSAIFDLKQARSKGAEGIVEAAKALMDQTNPSKDEIEVISRELVRVLPEDDEMWIRWLFFAQMKGVTI